MSVMNTPALASMPAGSSAQSAAYHFELYGRKYLGVDMALKTICYALRLLVGCWHTHDTLVAPLAAGLPY